MKKARKLAILVIVLGLCFGVGFIGNLDVVDLVEDRVSYKYIENVGSETEKNDENKHNEELVTETLSAEDIEVKTEICKYNENAANFKKNSIEKVGLKTHSICFLEVDSVSNYENVIYTNDTNDLFKYDIKTGELRYALIESAIVEKSKSSIDIDDAQKIADEYVSKRCDISEYTIDLSQETGEGFEFSYRRYIANYKTTDVFAINISFSGEITYIIDNTHVFNDIDISEFPIEEDLINLKISEIKGYLNDDMYFYEDSVLITPENGQLRLQYKIRQGTSVGTYTISLE